MLMYVDPPKIDYVIYECSPKKCKYGQKYEWKLTVGLSVPIKCLTFSESQAQAKLNDDYDKDEDEDVEVEKRQG